MAARRHILALTPISIARPKHTLVMAGGLEGETFIGPKAEVSDSRLYWDPSAVLFRSPPLSPSLQEHRGVMSIKYPIEVRKRTCTSEND